MKHCVNFCHKNFQSVEKRVNVHEKVFSCTNKTSRSVLNPLKSLNISDLSKNLPKDLTVRVKFRNIYFSCLEICVDVLITLQITNVNFLELSWPYKQCYCHCYFWEMCAMVWETRKKQFVYQTHFYTACVIWCRAKSHTRSLQPQNNVILAILSFKKIFFYVLHAVKFSMCFLCTILNAFLHTKNCWKCVTYLFSLIVCFL